MAKNEFSKRIDFLIETAPSKYRTQHSKMKWLADTLEIQLQTLSGYAKGYHYPSGRIIQQILNKKDKTIDAFWLLFGVTEKEYKEFPDKLKDLFKLINEKYKTLAPLEKAYLIRFLSDIMYLL